MNGNENSLEARRKYVTAYNSTMIRIWKEKIALLKVIDTGALYNSVVELGMNADAKITSVTLKQSFNLYGIFVDSGTGRNTSLGNPGDIGRDNPRVKKRWFSTKHFASVMNLREFFADNLGQEAAEVVSNALTKTISGRFLSN